MGKSILLRMSFWFLTIPLVFRLPVPFCFQWKGITNCPVVSKEDVYKQNIRTVFVTFGFCSQSFLLHLQMVITEQISQAPLFGCFCDYLHQQEIPGLYFKILTLS